MVQVNFKTKGEHLVSLEVSGHANYAAKGEDLVCAGISAIVIGAFNSFNEMAPDAFDFTVEDNLLRAVSRSSDPRDHELLSVVYYQLKTVEDQYSEFINIKSMEV